MPDGPSFLLIRGADLVVMGASTVDCVIEGEALRATSSDARITVTFPPQAIAETKIDGAQVQRAVLARPSTLAFDLPLGAPVPLGVAGFLSALRSLRLADASIELPFGLVMTPLDSAEGVVTVDHPGEPLARAGVHGLWQLDADSAAGLRLHPLDVVGGDEDMSFSPLSPGERATLLHDGHAADIARLRLSALGGTLTAHLDADSLEWDHDLALGRDRRVRFAQRGRLYPFGHAATFVETAERGFDGDAARLRREIVLRVTEPVRRLPEDGSRESRQFPFHAVEILTQIATDFQLETVESFRVPSEALEAMGLERARIENEEQGPAEEAFGKFRIPRSTFDLETSAYFDGSAAITLAEVKARIESLQQELDELTATGPPEQEHGTSRVEFVVEDDGTVVATPPPPPPPPPTAGSFFEQERVRRELKAANDEFESLIRTIDAQLVNIAREFPPGIEGNVDALADRGIGVAVTLRDVRARIADLRRRIEAASDDVPRMSRIMRDGSPVLFQVRCTGRLGDVCVAMPLIFLHDVRVGADSFFEGYSSFDDPELLSHVPAEWRAIAAPVPGVAVDLIRRSAPPKTTDIQEVHQLTVSGTQFGRDVRPVLEEFLIHVRELRCLIPSLPTAVGARMAEEFLGGGEAPEPIRLDPLEVRFDEVMERGGGILTPNFRADVISELFGPVDSRSLPGALDPSAAFAQMRLLGVKLSSLLGNLGDPPKIITLFEGGLPRGVRFVWDRGPLTSAGAFIAHRPSEHDDSTTLLLEIEQTSSSRSTKCSLSPFSLELPPGPNRLLIVTFESLAFTQRDGEAPTLKIGSFDFTFEGALELLKGLQEGVDLLGASFSVVARPDGLQASYALRLPDATAGVFAMRNIAVLIAVDVPFRAGSPSVTLGFASPEAPFQLSVPPFGGGGYIQIRVDASGMKRLEASLEFGGSASVNFVVARGEVHALAGVRYVMRGLDDATLSGFLRMGGSLSVLGLVSVSVELRLELTYEFDARRLEGRATLVIAVNLTIYADSVELDSGLWVFAGGGGATTDAVPATRRAPAPSNWEQYQGAYA